MTYCAVLIVLLAQTSTADAPAQRNRADWSDVKPVPLTTDEFTLFEEDINLTNMQGEKCPFVHFVLTKRRLSIPITHRDGSHMPLSGPSASWLLPKDLLDITWIEGPEDASGMYTTETHLIVEISEHGYRELLRDQITKFGKGGAMSFTQGSLSYHVATDQLDSSLIRVATVFSSDPEDEFGAQQYSLSERTSFQLIAHDLGQPHYSATLDLSGPPMSANDAASNLNPRGFTLDALASFLILKLTPRYLRYPCGDRNLVLPQEKAWMLEGLKESNPGIEQWPNMNRKIAIPYQRRPVIDLTPDNR